MASDQDAKAAREEFEVAYYTKELGRPLQRKLLQRRLDEIGDGHSVSAAHLVSQGEDADRGRRDKSPREGRTG